MDVVQSAVIVAGCCTVAGCGCAAIDPEIAVKGCRSTANTTLLSTAAFRDNRLFPETSECGDTASTHKRVVGMIRALVSLFGCTYIEHPSSSIDWEVEMPRRKDSPLEVPHNVWRAHASISGPNDVFFRTPLLPSPFVFETNGIDGVSQERNCSELSPTTVKSEFKQSISGCGSRGQEHCGMTGTTSSSTVCGTESSFNTTEGSTLLNTTRLAELTAKECQMQGNEVLVCCKEHGVVSNKSGPATFDQVELTASHGTCESRNWTAWVGHTPSARDTTSSQPHPTMQHSFSEKWKKDIENQGQWKHAAFFLEKAQKLSFTDSHTWASRVVSRTQTSPLLPSCVQLSSRLRSEPEPRSAFFIRRAYAESLTKEQQRREHTQHF